MQEEKKTVYLKRNANQQTKLLKSNKWNIRAFFICSLMCLNGRILFRLQVRVELNGDIPSPEFSLC